MPRPRAGGRDSMTESNARVRTRVAGPVATQVALTKPLRRATDLTGAMGVPVARAVAALMMRSTVSAGTEYSWVARSTTVPSARKT